MQPPQPDYIFRGHQDDVNIVRFFNNDKYIISGDAGGVVIIWLFQTRRPLFQWKAHTASCLSVHVVNQDKVISQGRDNLIHVWQIDFKLNTEPVLISSLPYYSLNYCQLSTLETDEGEIICFPSKGNTSLIDIYNVSQQSWVVQAIGDNKNEERRLCMVAQFIQHRSEDRSLLQVLAGYENGSVVLWQYQSRTGQIQLLWETQVHDQPVLCLAGIGGYLLSGSIDNRIIKYHLEDGHIIKEIKTKKPGTACLAIRQDNKIWATGGYDGRIRVYSVKTMKPLAILSYHRDSVYCVDFSKTSNWIIGSSKDHRISLWHVY